MRILSRATAVVRRVLDAVLIALILVVVFGVILGKVVPLTGRQTIIIGGSSMEPAIGVGSAIIVAPVAAADLHVGDVVSLRAGDDRSLFTHRIVRIVDQPDGRWVQTKGDANDTPDPTLTHASAIEGRVQLADPAGRLPDRAAVDPDGRPVHDRPRRDAARRGLAARVARAGLDRPRPVRRRGDARADARRADLGPPGRRPPACRRRRFRLRPPDDRRPDRAVSIEPRGDAISGRPRTVSAPTATRTDGRPMRRLLPLGLVVALLTGAAAAAPMTLAQLTAADASTLSIGTDTLAPPTSLAASGTATVSLTWTASNDAYAAGLPGPAEHDERERLRPREHRDSRLGDLDDGLAREWRLLLRAALVLPELDQRQQQRGSDLARPDVHRLQGRAPPRRTPPTPAATATATKSTAGNACADGGGIATDASTGTNTTLSCTDTGKDRHRFWDFSLGVPGTATVQGIALRADVGLNNNSGTATLCAQLSWDGGTNWTGLKSVAVTNVAETTYTLGGASDTWGRTWTGSQLSNANFRVRLVDVSDRSTKDFRLDYVAVNVTYTP